MIQHLQIKVMINFHLGKFVDMHGMREERMKVEGKGKGCDMQEDEHEDMADNQADMKKYMKNMMKEMKHKRKQMEKMMKELVRGKIMMKSKITITMQKTMSYVNPTPHSQNLPLFVIRTNIYLKYYCFTNTLQVTFI